MWGINLTKDCEACVSDVVMWDGYENKDSEA